MASQHDEDIHEGTPGYKLSQPKQSLATYQQMAADVEELLRLLCSKTGTPIPSIDFLGAVATTHITTSAAANAVSSAASASASAPASSSPPNKPSNANEEHQKHEASTMLTVPGHGGTDDSRDQKGPVFLNTGPIVSDSASPGPSLGLGEMIDAGDESLQRYKESLGLGGGKDLSDPSDPRVCIIKGLTMETQGREPVTIDLSDPGAESTLKDHPFTIKEGSRFTMVATFKVQHEVLSGLRYVQIVKRKGVRVSKDNEMLGSYAPSTDRQPLYTKRFQEDEAPSGMLARGHYVAQSSFVDDDKKTHLAFEWSFNIAKDW